MKKTIAVIFLGLMILFNFANTTANELPIEEVVVQGRAHQTPPMTSIQAYDFVMTFSTSPNYPACHQIVPRLGAYYHDCRSTVAQDVQDARDLCSTVSETNVFYVSVGASTVKIGGPSYTAHTPQRECQDRISAAANLQHDACTSVYQQDMVSTSCN